MDKQIDMMMVMNTDGYGVHVNAPLIMCACEFNHRIWQNKSANPDGDNYVVT